MFNIILSFQQFSPFILAYYPKLLSCLQKLLLGQDQLSDHQQAEER